MALIFNLSIKNEIVFIIDFLKISKALKLNQTLTKLFLLLFEKHVNLLLHNESSYKS